MARIHALSLVCCLLLTGAALGQQQRKVNLKSGLSYTGAVSETPEGYRIETRFGVVNVAKDDVASVEELITPEAEYAKRLQTIDVNSAEDHLKLAQWAIAQDALEIARKELQESLRIRPDYELAKLLLRQVEVKIAAQEVPGEPGAAPGPVGPQPAVRGLDPEWLLTLDEVSRIRVEELRADERLRGVSFENDVVNRFILLRQGRGDFEQAGFERQFLSYPPVRKARYIMDHLDRSEEDIKRDIVVKTDPQFMQEFRTRVMPVISAYCATSACHGGEQPVGRLRLFPVPGRNAQFEYTNFLILDSYVVDGRRMIDRDRPELSLLLQYGLPVELSQTPHPVKIKTPYTSLASPNYRRVRDWIDSLKGPPHPDYGTTLRIPWAPKGGGGFVIPEEPKGEGEPSEEEGANPLMPEEADTPAADPAEQAPLGQ